MLRINIGVAQRHAPDVIHITISVAVLTVMTMAETAAEQDRFEVETKRSSQLSTEANDASRQKQIHKACEGEATRMSHAGDPEVLVSYKTPQAAPVSLATNMVAK